MPQPILKKLITSGKDGVNGMATLIEEEAERHILLRALQAGEGVKVEVVDLDGRGNTQDRVIRISSTADLLQGPPGPPGPGGDSVTAVNRGDGYKLFINKDDLDLNLRTLKQGPGIKITEGTDTITIEALPTSTTNLPVTNGGTGLTSVDANALLVGNGTNALKKLVPNKAGSLPLYDGNAVVWKQRLLPVVITLTFNSTQQISSVTTDLVGSIATILGPNSFSFTNPLAPMVPVSSQILGSQNNKWISRTFSSTFRFEVSADGSQIDVIGCSSTAAGTTAPGNAKIIFMFDLI